MTKDVLLSITGLRFDAEAEEAVEVINRGEYYFKNGKHYIIYDEISEEAPNEITKCTVKLAGDKIEIIKNGDGHVHMSFELNKNNFSCYSTPFGDFMLGIKTTAIDLEESEGHISAQLRYDLDINYEHASCCNLKIEVQGS